MERVWESREVYLHITPLPTIQQNKPRVGLYVKLRIYMHQTFPFAKCEEKSRTSSWCWVRVAGTVFCF